jgi:hypothetical protein
MGLVSIWPKKSLLLDLSCLFQGIGFSGCPHHGLTDRMAQGIFWRHHLWMLAGESRWRVIPQSILPHGIASQLLEFRR